MLPEIFQTIVDELLQTLKEKQGKNNRVEVLMEDTGKKNKNRWIRLELLRFGTDHEHKAYVHESPADKSFYNFTFFITTQAPRYSGCLELTELVCDHFDKKPFLQIRLGEREYEVAISSMELTVEELNHFWMARRVPHRPALFYQARISEV